MAINKYYASYDVIDDKYILIRYQNEQFGNGKSLVDVYDIKTLTSMQIIETKYKLIEFIKLKDN